MNPHHHAERQKRTRANLIRTLEDWAHQERQVEYKKTVPFVHVPRELLAQWNNYANLLKEQDCFIESLNERELAAVISFDNAIAAFNEDDQLPDVPEVFGLPVWLELMQKAGELLAVLKMNE